MLNHSTLFDIHGLTAIVTGGSGGLGSAIAIALAEAGVHVAVIGLHPTSSTKVVEAIHAAGGEAIGIACDVTDKADLERAHTKVLDTFGGVDILINGAGGNVPQATTSTDISFFDLDAHAIDAVLGLNFTGTFQSCQVFGRSMIERGQGCIVNIASMNALRPLTRIPAYSAAKAAVANFTQWLAIHMAQEYSVQIRVNAICPGFFVTEQNRFLLTVFEHTPMGRFGKPEDVVGTVLWLVSPASAFVTGTLIPIDGGFSAFSGV